MWQKSVVNFPSAARSSCMSEICGKFCRLWMSANSMRIRVDSQPLTNSSRAFWTDATTKLAKWDNAERSFRPKKDCDAAAFVKASSLDIIPEFCSCICHDCYSCNSRYGLQCADEWMNPFLWNLRFARNLSWMYAQENHAQNIMASNWTSHSEFIGCVLRSATLIHNMALWRHPFKMHKICLASANRQMEILEICEVVKPPIVTSSPLLLQPTDAMIAAQLGKCSINVDVVSEPNDEGGCFSL